MMSEVNWKWEEFSPKIIQMEKRERENVAIKGIKMIKKNFNELGISSFMSVPIIDRNRAVKKIVHTDLEKAASGASGACGHFVINPAILRTS